MSPEPMLQPEELLAEIGWLRSLALQVAGDPHLAEDLTQDALVVALTRQERPRSLRKWLATIVRNLERTAHRSKVRRTVREAQTERPTAAVSTLDLVERAASHRRLVDELLALDEPYRSILLLRFFEQRSARDIAKQTGVPQSTVASQTKEGLRRLRCRLERGNGNKQGTWLSAILPILRRPQGAPLPSALTGVLALSLSTKLTLGGGLVIASLMIYRGLGPLSPTAMVGPTVESTVARASAPAHLPAEPSLTSAPVDRTARTPIENNAAAAPPLPEGHPEPFEFRGHVIDLAGLSIPGVEVCAIRFGPFRGELPREPTKTCCVVSDSAGNFHITGAPQPPLGIEVRSERYTTVYKGFVMPLSEGEAPEEDSVVIVAWRIPLEGVVVDAEGNGIPGAQLSIHASHRMLQQQGNLLANAVAFLPETVTDQHGSFAFEDAAEIPGAKLAIEAPGYPRTTVPIPVGGDANLRIVLLREMPGTLTVAGRVILENGAPAEGALVSTGTMSTSTNEDGLFSLKLDHAFQHMARDTPILLRAAMAGVLPATLSLPSPREAETEGMPGDVLLVLGGPPKSLRGRVVDGEGRGLVGVSVFALDTTNFGLVRSEFGQGYSKQSVEDIAGGGEVTTQEGGYFHLQGLMDHPYRVQATARKALLIQETEPVPVGTTDLVIVLDLSELGSITGTIVDRHGQGVFDVSVAVSGHLPGRLAIGHSAKTDMEGHFEIKDVSRTPPFLRLMGRNIVPEIFRTVPEGADMDNLTLQVSLRCNLQIEWGDTLDRADRLIPVDEHGTPVNLMKLEGNGVTPLEHIRVGRGLSAVFAISDAATHAVLSKHGQEVRRVRLHPRPGELEMLRL